MRRSIILSVAALLLLSGVGIAAIGGVTVADTAGVGPTFSDSHASSEQIGVWDGTRHDAELNIDQSDGLTESELTQVVDRSMARVEYVRERPFKEDVPVSTLTRAEYQTMISNSGEQSDTEAEFNRWNDQVWRALFIVGDDSSSADELEGAFGGAVAGFYQPSEDQIVLVVAEGEQLQISEATLVHELNHAMQDQYYDLTASRFSGATQDADLAVEGVVEGEANYVEDHYEQRCSDEWQCLDAPDGDGSGPGDLNFGIVQTILQPYQDGPVLVDQLVETQGWDAVDRAFNAPPQTSSQVIHGELDREPREIEFQDTSATSWETYPNQGANGAETVGEASMYVMFWYQAFEYGAPTLGESQQTAVQNHIMESGSFNEEYYSRLGYDRAFNYRHPATDGWANDKLYPYRNDAGDETKDGYVWVTEWETDRDAREFANTYDDMLTAHDATRRDSGIVDIKDDPFGGAYGVERAGKTVTIVYAPEPAGVFELRPEISLDETTSQTSDEQPETPSADDSSVSETENSATETPAVSDETPGFGVTAVAILTLISAFMFRRYQ